MLYSKDNSKVIVQITREEDKVVISVKDFVELKDCFNLITKGKSLKTKAL
jgi:hypothetical protein